MSKKSIKYSHNEEETRQIAARFAQTLVPKEKNALVVALSGDLGAGKTVFAQGFARGLGAKTPIKSPTFLIVRHVSLVGNSFSQLVHIDCYRVKDSSDILTLGWKDMLENPGNILLVEWADRIREILPEDTIWVSLRSTGEHTREIRVLSQELPGIRDS